MSKKNPTWGGRFSKKVSPTAVSFSSSIEVDKVMYEQDIKGSIAYAEALKEVKVLSNNKEDYFAISGGFAQVSKDKVSLLVESIELKDEIDKERSNESLKRAQSRLKDKTMDQARAGLALARAKNRLKVSSR